MAMEWDEEEIDPMDEKQKSERSTDFQKNAREIKSKIRVVPDAHGMFVIVLAVHPESGRNTINKIPTKRGVPIGGYVYDNLHDCYLAKCMDMFTLGPVQISFKIEMEEAAYWSIHVPVPEAVIMRYLSGRQKNDLKMFKENFNSCTFQFIQLVNTNQ